MAGVLQISGLRKSYGNVEALRGIDVQVAPGEIFGLLGPNGAGKSSTVSIVAGLTRPDGGTVTVDGIDVRSRPRDAQRRIGLCPQETGLHMILSVRENLEYFGRLARLGGALLKQRVDDAVERLGLDDIVNRRVADLSSGQRRRAHVAAAILHRPPLLVLDEPTAFLDAHGRAQVLQVVRDLAGEGAAVVYSTHVLSEVEDVCGRATIIHHGRELASGPVSQLISRFGHSQIMLEFTEPFDEGMLAQAGLNVSEAGENKVLVRGDGEEPQSLLAHAMRVIGGQAAGLASVTVIRPSLEAVFLTLTGRPVDVEEPAAEEVAS